MTDIFTALCKTDVRISLAKLWACFLKHVVSLITNADLYQMFLYLDPRVGCGFCKWKIQLTTNQVTNRLPCFLSSQYELNKIENYLTMYDLKLSRLLCIRKSLWEIRGGNGDLSRHNIRTADVGDAIFFETLNTKLK